MGIVALIYKICSRCICAIECIMKIYFRNNCNVSQIRYLNVSFWKITSTSNFSFLFFLLFEEIMKNEKLSFATDVVNYLFLMSHTIWLVLFHRGGLISNHFILLVLLHCKVFQFHFQYMSAKFLFVTFRLPSFIFV